METLELNKQIGLVQAMLAEDFDWENHEGDDIDDEFQKCITFEIDPEAKFIGCGSVRTEDTAASLYRLLWLCKPKEPIDFSDMYKRRVLLFGSVDRRFYVEAYLYKYELALYFYAPKELCDTSGASGLIGGFPGADNGISCTDADGLAFFKMATDVLNTPHLVYGGNNFEV